MAFEHLSAADRARISRQIRARLGLPADADGATIARRA